MAVGALCEVALHHVSARGDAVGQRALALVAVELRLGDHVLAERARRGELLFLRLGRLPHHRLDLLLVLGVHLRTASDGGRWGADTMATDWQKWLHIFSADRQIFQAHNKC